MRLLMFAIAAAVTLPLAAATRYAIAVETTGDVLQRPLSATLLAEGSQRRIDVVRPETPFTFDLLLSDDGGVTFTGLNTALKTWFRIGPMALVGRPRIYAPMLNARRSVGGVKVTASVAQVLADHVSAGGKP